MQDKNATKCPREKRQNTEHVDRISNLPDPILTHILSFLTTKEAVQTSLLAKRYQNLWASVPVLDLDFDDFLPSCKIKEKMENSEENFCEYEEKFVKFINGVFKRREPLTLASFKLGWVEDNSDPTPATTWLATATKLKAKFLSAHISTDNYSFEVPEEVFTSESLEELVLQLGFETINPSSVNLPCLKKLTLNSVVIEDEVMQKLLSGLPALEEMVLHNCLLNFGCIFSGTLKRLVIDGYENDENSSEIQICIPSLAFLEVHSWAMGKLKFKGLKSLVGAHIHFKEFSDEEPLFLTGLSNVTSLELVLSVSALMGMKNVLEKPRTKFPTLDNLKTLKIGGWSITRDFDLVAHFLLHAPNLKNLTLLHCEAQGFSKKNIEISLQLGDSLDIMKINYKKNDESAIKLVRSVEAHFQTIRKANNISRPLLLQLFV